MHPNVPVFPSPFSLGTCYNPDWLIPLFASVVIGQRNLFGFGFTILSWLYCFVFPVLYYTRRQELLDCVTHIRLLSWLLHGSLSHFVYSQNPHVNCHPVKFEENTHIADYVLIILFSFAEQLKVRICHQHQNQNSKQSWLCSSSSWLACTHRKIVLSRLMSFLLIFQEPLNKSALYHAFNVCEVSTFLGAYLERWFPLLFVIPFVDCW